MALSDLEFPQSETSVKRSTSLDDLAAECDPAIHKMNIVY